MSENSEQNEQKKEVNPSETQNPNSDGLGLGVTDTSSTETDTPATETANDEKLLGENNTSTDVSASAPEETQEEVVEQLSFTKNLPITEKQHFETIVNSQKGTISSLRKQLSDKIAEAEALKKEISEFNKEI